jgi:hypothetical protein
VIVVSAEAREALGLKAGDTVYLHRADSAVIGSADHDTDHDARLARGRAFLKRYHRTFEALGRG